MEKEEREQPEWVQKIISELKKKEKSKKISQSRTNEKQRKRY